MKKLLPLLLLTTFLYSGISAQEVSFVEIWAKYGVNAPAWFTDGTEPDQPGGDNSFAGTERGIVYSNYSGHLYVSSRHAEDNNSDGIPDRGEPHVYVLDPLTGSAPAFGIAQLLTSGITSSDANFGGGYPLNNVTATPDGSIIACNMTLASGPDIVGTDGAITVKAFRVYRWSWEQDIPSMIIDYKEGGYRLGDKLSVIGNWDTEAYIYAGISESNKLLRWKVTGGIVDAAPTTITLQDITTAGTSITVAPVPSKSDWIYVSGKGLAPTLFTTGGVNLSQVAINMASMPSSIIAGRTIEYGGRLLMIMFSGDQSAFILDLTKQGENVTDADIIGFTPVFGTKFANAYGEGAVDFGIISEDLYAFVCAPSNGIACYRVDGLINSVKNIKTEEFNVSAYPNPANDFVNIRYTLPQDARGAVAIKIFDMSGKFIGLTADEAQAGPQEIQINTSKLSSGTYTYQVVYNQKLSTGKLIIK
ncbi:MAG: T9SS type A sorting domain-containing protein [Bacteroidales bacterium]|nr:T9SS type A sorting domain-containing protein [Bacteroidales bacterium]MCF8391148.1 T9SS type A sorting domain-containing protein [Bacteroidales bacterium]